VSNGLYDSTLDKLFEAQPQLRWFRDRDCFLSFVEWLTPLQRLPVRDMDKEKKMITSATPELKKLKKVKAKVESRTQTNP